LRVGKQKLKAAAEVRKCFAGQFSVGKDRDADAVNAVERALDRPDLYVLKPQREGGGNNFYGEDLVRRLRAGNLDDMVLMERILPPPQPAILVRRGQVSTGPTLSELGVFGAFLAVEGHNTTATVLINEYAGHILRTKSDGVDEGGVATGYSVLSSPILI